MSTKETKISLLFIKLLFVALVILLTLIRYKLTLFEIPENTKVRYKGSVISEPQIRGDKRMIKLDKGLIVWLPLYPEVYYGDKVVIEGEYENGVISNPKLIEYNTANNPLLKIRKNIIYFYNSILPPDYGSLVAGMTMGSKEYISQNLRETLKKSGTTHVIVASGMNVVLIGGFIFKLSLGCVSRKKAALLAISFCWIYTLIAGLEAPLVRASIMISISTVALLYGRIYSSVRALILTGLIMIWIKPVWIIDIGFQLSFASTLSLIVLGKKFDKLLTKIPSLFREGLSTSLAAQAGVTPLIFYYFGSINLLSPFINALVLWTVPFITIIGMAAGLIALIIPYVAKIILWLVVPLIWWFLIIITTFGNLRF